MCVSPPSVNQMVKMLETKDMIQRTPGQARSLQVLVFDKEVPSWNTTATGKSPPQYSGEESGCHAEEITSLSGMTKQHCRRTARVHLQNGVPLAYHE